MRKTSPYARRQRQAKVVRHYSLLDELTASHIEPLPLEWRTHHLTRMWQGLAALETAPNPGKDDWRVCSDAVNMLETLVTRGPWMAGELMRLLDATVAALGGELVREADLVDEARKAA